MNTTTTEARKFEIGQIVDTGTGDYIWTFEVIARTKCFVTFRQTNTDETYRVKVQTSDWSGDVAEWALPFGKFSMAPTVRA